MTPQVEGQATLTSVQLAGHAGIVRRALAAVFDMDVRGVLKHRPGQELPILDRAAGGGLERAFKLREREVRVQVGEGAGDVVPLNPERGQESPAGIVLIRRDRGALRDEVAAVLDERLDR